MNQRTAYVYVDNYVEQITAGHSSLYPGFYYYSEGGEIYNSYPLINQFYTNRPIAYDRCEAGPHTFLFTDSANTVVAEAVADMPARSWWCVYFTDGDSTATGGVTYKTLIYEEKQEVQTGKTSIRFVHLSADAEELNIAKLQADGTETVAGRLAFLTSTDYTYYDKTAVTSNGLIAFRLENETADVSLTVGVPFVDGALYEVIIRGFKTGQRRKLTFEEKQFSVYIAPKLKTEIRRTY